MNFLAPKTAEEHLSASRNYLARLDIGSPDESVESISETAEETTILEGTIEEETIEVPLQIETKPNLGRGGVQEIPDFVKSAIASVVHSTDAKQMDIAEAFGVSSATVSNIAHGLDGSRRPNEQLQKEIQHTRDSIETEALGKLMLTLGLIDESDLLSLGVKDKAIVATNLSKVAANMKAQTSVNDNRVQMIIHAPRVRDDYHYQEIEV